jgi:hypothetical protein
MPLFLSGFLLLAAYPLIGTTMAVWVLAASQFALLLGEIRKRQVSGAGAFIFMSLLFFGVRPIYLILENDYALFRTLFVIRVDLAEVGDSMWWASAALLCFAVGARMAPLMNRAWLQRRRRKAAADPTQAVISSKVASGMMVFQLLTLPVMFWLSRSGRGLYGSALGAYAYDLPVPLQSVHIVAVVVLLERYLRTRSPQNLIMLGISGLLFLNFTWWMRDVSLFRGFYVAGAMIAGLAAVQRIKGRAGYVWIIVPIVLLQPFFGYLGGDRYKKNEELAQEGIIEEVIGQESLAQAYWQFYDSGGDMNIFDTFVAAKKAAPAFYPYVWSWAYVPLHFIPRKLWKGKPERGVTQDLEFLRGAPYAPGIAGFFLLDGGLLWMLGSMAVLGFLIGTLDGWVFTLPRGYLQYCLIGVVTVNAMFLTRFFLWQYFYQMLYAMIPIMALAWWFGRNARHTASLARNQRRTMEGARGAAMVGANQRALVVSDETGFNGKEASRAKS